MRTRLRADTSAAHEALDRQVSRHDLTTIDGLRSYLTMHAAALTTLHPFARNCTSATMIDDLLDRTSHDLSRFGPPPARRSMPAHFHPNPLAIDYVVLGAQLGSAILKKRWQKATDPAVRDVASHFSAPSYMPLWQQFCQSAAAQSPSSDQADQIVQDANMIFDLYAACLPAAHPKAQNV